MVTMYGAGKEGDSAACSATHKAFMFRRPATDPHHHPLQKGSLLQCQIGNCLLHPLRCTQPYKRVSCGEPPAASSRACLQCCLAGSASWACAHVSLSGHAACKPGAKHVPSVYICRGYVCTSMAEPGQPPWPYACHMCPDGAASKETVPAE